MTAKVMTWLALLPLYMLAHLVAYLLAPFIALLGEATAQRWFSWFLTPDSPITGDKAHEQRWLGKPRYVQKVAWLWRNRAYGFTTTVLRAKANSVSQVIGNPDVTDYNGGTFGTVIRLTPEGYWQYYRITPTRKGKCLRINLGWKFNDLANVQIFGQYVFSINPGMRIK